MMKPAVMLVDPIHPIYLARLERAARVVRPDGHDEEALARCAAAEQVSAIVIRTKGCVTEKILRASTNLKIVGRHGIGVEHIDIDAATRAGVWVVNTPEGSRIAAAEHTWGLILALAKHVSGGDFAVRAGDFAFRERSKSLQLYGKTLGIVGLGRIGTTVARIGVRGFGMKILYNDLLRFPAKESSLGARKCSLKKLLAHSDVVSVHTPLDESTRNLIGAAEVKLMRAGALLLNCARGAIVDAGAVAEALKAGRLGGAGFDVFVPEEPPPEHPLLNCPNAILSPHSAAQTLEANLGYGAVVEDVLRVLKRQRPKFPLNEPKLARPARIDARRGTR